MTTLENLARFVEDYNDNTLPESTAKGVPASAYKAYADEVLDSISKDDLNYRYKLRLSGIGKPPVVQAMKLLGYDEPVIGIGRLRKGIFHMGREFEARFKMMLRLYGHHYGLQLTGEELEADFLGVKGHADGELNNDLVVEFKTMGAGSFRQASRVGMTDDLGYITQLSTYSHALGKPGVWIVEDKTRTNIKLIAGPDETTIAEKLDRAEDIITGLRAIEAVLKAEGHDAALDLAINTFEAPAPRTYRNQQLLPWAMVYSPFKEVFYDYVQDDDKAPQYLDHSSDEDIKAELVNAVEDERLTYAPITE